MKLTGRLAAVGHLTPAQRNQMFVLMDRHYHHVVRNRFEADLAEKQWVILVEDEARELCGFSTQVLLSTHANGRPIQALFSGDTIVDRRHWGERALERTWGRLALSLMDAHADQELYWFLMSKGYKTYRFLPLFFHEFYPRPEEPTPADSQQIIDQLGRLKFCADYDPARGVVAARAGKDCLREDVAPVSAERLRDPFVRFFVQRNPGHARGEELCCLAPLTRANFTPAAYRVIGPSPVLEEVAG